MSENNTRKGERTKKPPKYMQYDDADYGNFVPAKTVEQKQKAYSAAETTQIAKLFHKFINTANQKLRHYLQEEHPDKLSNDHQLGFQLQGKKENIMQSIDHNSFRPSGMQSGGSKKTRENLNCSVEMKGGKQEVKKNGSGLRSQPHISPSIQEDLDYHNMINEHIRSACPNFSNLSPDMLKGLDIPKQLLERNNPASKPKHKEERAKNNQILKNGRVSKDSKEELKPFKRQSYHVAIAYHIHIEKLKNASGGKDIDPTSAARKLRQQAGGRDK